MNKIQRKKHLLPNKPNKSLSAISLVIPLYNEAGNIHRLVEEIIAALEQAHEYLKQYEIILVNDGSNDNSGEIIASLEAQNNTIIAILLSRYPILCFISIHELFIQPGIMLIIIIQG